MSTAFPLSPIPVEILSHLLSSLACLSRSPLPFPPSIIAPSPQAVSGSISFAPSSAPGPSHVGTGEGLLAYLHTTLSLRVSHFLLLIWASGGWGSIALSSLMAHSLPRSFPPPLGKEYRHDAEARRKRDKNLATLCAKSQLSRSIIYGHAGSALGPHHRAMMKTEQLDLHVEVVWLTRWLDMGRKEAGVTREVVKRVGVMVVEGREEARRSTTDGSTSGGYKPKSFASEQESAVVGLGLGMAVSSQRPSQVAVRRKESTEGNMGVMGLLERVCEVMGVDLLDFEREQLEGKERRRESLNSSRNARERRPRFGWPELQVEMMKEGISIVEALPGESAVL
jgi:hypothetical protein